MKLSLLLPLIAVASANPNSRGKVSVEVDHVDTDALTPACHNVLVEAFNMAYEEVYGIHDMTNNWDSYDAIPEKSLDTKLGYRSHWWRYMYYPDWTCGRWCDDEFDGPIMLGDAVQHAQFENAMTSLVRASTCADFRDVTAIKIVDQALVKHNLPVAKAPVPKLPLRENQQEGKVSVEVDHVDTDELSEACHNVLVEAFNMAYEEVYGVHDMTNNWDSYDAIPEKSLDTKLGYRSHWWRYMYYPDWTCGRWCDDEFDGPIMLGNAVQHAQFENAMTSLVRASTCADFRDVTAIKIVDQALVKRNALKETSGQVSIEVDHVNTKELSNTCHDVLVDAFDMAYEEVYGVHDMKNDFDQYDAIPESSMLDWLGSGYRSHWWRYMYYPEWTCGRWCDDEFDGPVMLKDSKQHAQFENAMTSLLRASICEAFQDVTAIKIVDAATVGAIRGLTSTVETK